MSSISCNTLIGMSDYNTIKDIEQDRLRLSYD